MIHSLKLLFLFFSEGFCRAGREAEDVFGRHTSAPAVCGGGVLVSAALQTESVPGGKRPQRPVRAFCSHQPGYALKTEKDKCIINIVFFFLLNHWFSLFSPVDLSPSVLVELLGCVRSSRLRLVMADAIFRNLCCRNEFTVGDEPLSLKKMVRVFFFFFYLTIYLNSWIIWVIQVNCAWYLKGFWITQQPKSTFIENSNFTAEKTTYILLSCIDYCFVPVKLWGNRPDITPIIIWNINTRWCFWLLLYCY